MEISNLTLPWCYLIVTWGANINDLIRGHWFYNNTQAILFWNFMGILAMGLIIYENNKKKEEDHYEDKSTTDKKGRRTRRIRWW